MREILLILCVIWGLSTFRNESVFAAVSKTPTKVIVKAARILKFHFIHFHNLITYNIDKQFKIGIICLFV